MVSIIFFIIILLVFKLIFFGIRAEYYIFNVVGTEYGVAKLLDVFWSIVCLCVFILFVLSVNIFFVFYFVQWYRCYKDEHLVRNTTDELKGNSIIDIGMSILFLVAISKRYSGRNVLRSIIFRLLFLYINWTLDSPLFLSVL